MMDWLLCRTKVSSKLQHTPKYLLMLLKCQKYHRRPCNDHTRNSSPSSLLLPMDRLAQLQSQHQKVRSRAKEVSHVFVSRFLF